MGAKIKLNTPYSTYKAIYSGGGNNALIDGQLGSNSTYADGHWQGYWGDSIDATIDFGKPTEIHEVTMRFMQNTFDWILAPKEIKAYVSNDGKEWDLVSDWTFDMDPRETGMRLKNYTVPLNSQFSCLAPKETRPATKVPIPDPCPRGTPLRASPPTSSPTKSSCGSPHPVPRCSAQQRHRPHFRALHTRVVDSFVDQFPHVGGLVAGVAVVVAPIPAGVEVGRLVD